MVEAHDVSLHDGVLCAVQQQVGSFAMAVDHSADANAAENNPLRAERLRMDPTHCAAVNLRTKASS